MMRDLDLRLARCLYSPRIREGVFSETPDSPGPMGYAPPDRGAADSLCIGRRCILDDIYRAHHLEEIVAVISPEVAARLDRTSAMGCGGSTGAALELNRSPSPPRTAATSARSTVGTKSPARSGSLYHYLTQGYRALWWMPLARLSKTTVCPPPQGGASGNSRQASYAVAIAEGG